MPRYIAKFGGLYCEWSTIVDAPVTALMTRERFEAYYRETYGTDGMRNLPERMERVEATGCSSQMGDTTQDLLEFNRAGKREGRVTTEAKMVEIYREDDAARREGE